MNNFLIFSVFSIICQNFSITLQKSHEIVDFKGEFKFKNGNLLIFIVFDKGNLSLSFYDDETRNPNKLDEDFLSKVKSFNSEILVDLEFLVENKNFRISSSFTIENTVKFITFLNSCGILG